MKRIFFLIISLLLLISIFTTACFASETELPQEQSETVFSRVWEYIDTYSEEIISYAADILVVIVIAFATKGGKKLTANLANSLSKCASENTQASVVNALNSMIQELNTERDENAELKNMITLLKTDLSNVHKETRAIFDAMLSVWGNSKNLPQGIKELLALKYSSCLKSEEPASMEVIENDERKND